MKSRTISTIVLAAAALVGASAFAEMPDPVQSSPSVSTKTRAEVKNELLQAQRQGYNSSGNFKNYPEADMASSKTRAEVRAELAAAGTLASNGLYSSH